MAVITGQVKNVAGDLAGQGFIAVKAKKERGATGTFIDTREHRIVVTDGALVAAPNITPGPVSITVSVSATGASSRSSWDQFDAVIPDQETVDLWDLKEQTYTYEPPVVSQVQAYKTAAEAARDAAVVTGAAPAFPDTGITYNPDDSVATVTENGVTTTYTYNADGTVNTDNRLGVTRTYTYDGSGNLTGIAS